MFKRGVKRVEGDITISFSEYDKKVHIYIVDRGANVLIAGLSLSPEDFCFATIGNLANRRCDVEIGDLNKIGKKMVIDKLEFKLPDGIQSYNYNIKEIAGKLAVESCPEGWKPDLSFNSQNSFFYDKEGNRWARTRIRKWVDK